MDHNTHDAKTGSTAAAAAAVAEPINIPISKESARRILSDVRELMTCPLHDNGIYYVHDEVDILVGYAMLHGQPGTSIFPPIIRTRRFRPRSSPMTASRACTRTTIKRGTCAYPS